MKKSSQETQQNNEPQAAPYTALGLSSPDNISGRDEFDAILTYAAGHAPDVSVAPSIKEKPKPQIIATEAHPVPEPKPAAKPLVKDVAAWEALLAPEEISAAEEPLAWLAPIATPEKARFPWVDRVRLSYQAFLAQPTTEDAIERWAYRILMLSAVGMIALWYWMATPYFVPTRQDAKLGLSTVEPVHVVRNTLAHLMPLWGSVQSIGQNVFFEPKNKLEELPLSVNLQTEGSPVAMLSAWATPYSLNTLIQSLQADAQLNFVWQNWWTQQPTEIVPVATTADNYMMSTQAPTIVHPYEPVAIEDGERLAPQFVNPEQFEDPLIARYESPSTLLQHVPADPIAHNLYRAPLAPTVPATSEVAPAEPPTASETAPIPPQAAAPEEAATEGKLVKRVINAQRIEKRQRMNAATRLLQQGDALGAIVFMKQLQKDMPDSVEVLVKLGELYLQTGQLNRLQSELQTLDPILRGSPEVKWLEARLKLVQEKPAEALDILDGLQSMRNEIAYLSLLAATHQQLSHHDKALEIYWQLLQNNPHNGQWWAGLSVSMEALEDTRSALMAYQRALQYPLEPTLRDFVADRIARLQER